MSKGAQIALATVWALWSLGWGFLWALTGIGLIVTLLCVPIAVIPFFFIRERKSYVNSHTRNGLRSFHTGKDETPPDQEGSIATVAPPVGK